MNTAMRTLNHISNANMPVINNSSCKNFYIYAILKESELHDSAKIFNN